MERANADGDKAGGGSGDVVFHFGLRRERQFDAESGSE
jgi:hypothetical protein